jgi:hypothetical protein
METIAQRIARAQLEASPTRRSQDVGSAPSNPRGPAQGRAASQGQGDPPAALPTFPEPMSRDGRPGVLLAADDKEAADRIYGLLVDLLDGEQGIITLSAQSADRAHLERALTAARTRAPRRPPLRLLP